MPVEDMAAVMADLAAAMAGTVADMRRRPMFEEDTVVLLFEAGVVPTLLDTRAEMWAVQGAHFMPLAAVAGQVVAGEAVAGAVIAGEAATGIHGMDIQGTAWAIMDWVTAIRTTAITVTVPLGGTIRITHIILTDTDTRSI